MRFKLRRGKHFRRTGAVLVALRFDGAEAEALRGAATEEECAVSTLARRMVRHCLADLDREADTDSD